MVKKRNDDAFLMGPHRDAAGSSFAPNTRVTPGGRSDIAGPPDPDSSAETPQVDAKGLPILTLEQLSDYKKAGFDIEVQGGGLTGKLLKE